MTSLVQRAHSSFSAALLLSLLVSLGCGSSDDRDSFNGSIDVDAPDAATCDPLDQKKCLLPFPSDFFTVADDSTDTGRRIQLPAEGTPANREGVHVDPTEWNRNDGFSPGTQIVTFVPGLDLAQTGAAPITDIGASLAGDSPVVIWDVDGGKRVPHWTELDANTDTDRVLFVRPAVALAEGHRYVVALRGLRNAAGEEIPPPDAFRAYRDRLNTNDEVLEARRESFEDVFEDLEDAGVARGDLHLAWDFTIASERNLSERILRMRDDAFARLGDASPSFTVTQVEENFDDRVSRRISGTFEVPLYMTGGGAPGTRISYGADGLPAWTGTYTADFRCIVPFAALAGTNGAAVPARPALYGHGLLGAEGEVSASNVRSMANEHNFVFCATKWIGMSEQDVGNAISILTDFSKFPTLADRTQQGILNTLFLGRLMIHENGLSSHESFQGSDGVSVIDRSELYYDGNSQGGIMGGAATAVAIDWTRAVLGVPGMNYSILLDRSVDFDPFNEVYVTTYLGRIERILGIQMVQMLWDRGEASGYAHHLTDDPLPGTPAHTVLMHVAFGDHQVASATAEIEARTIGARIHAPAVTPGRLPDVEPYWDIPAIPSYPWNGSALVIWDSGAPVPPLENVAPRAGEDPHGDPRSDPDARVQKSEFLRPDGAVVDVCGGEPCPADPS
ncbi:MAG: hypothetical protein FJ144_04715 [Deltaproteobacteria bacterium]|nr:hypothetical protein [Deltaproteobacteria bacterium]